LNPQRSPCFQPRGAARNGHGVSGAQAAFPSKALRNFPRRVRRPSCSQCFEASSAPQEITLVAFVVHRAQNAPKLLPRLRKSPSSRPSSIVFTMLRNFFRASGNLPRRVRRPSCSQRSETSSTPQEISLVAFVVHRTHNAPNLKKCILRDKSSLSPLVFFCRHSRVVTRTTWPREILRAGISAWAAPSTLSTRQKSFGQGALDQERARGSCQKGTKGTLNNTLTKRNPRVPQHFPMMRVGTSEHGVVQGFCPWIEI